MLLRISMFSVSILLGTMVHVRADQVLLAFGKNTDLAAIEVHDARLTLRGDWLQIATGRKQPWPGITLKAPGGHWDLAACQYVAIDVKNLGPQPVDVSCRVDNPGADGVKNCVTGHITLKPKEQKTLTVHLTRQMPEELRSKLFGMRGYPGGWSESGGINPSNIDKLLIFVAKPSVNHRFEIAKVRAGGLQQSGLPLDEKELFPLIDAFGQFVHKDWPGKMHTLADFSAQKQAEEADLAAHPGPREWDQYGGWQAGPLLKAGGRFRTEKYQGKWWLVDPEGRLFWSHGIDCVRTENATPVTDRKHWFADLPDKDSPLAAFFGRGNWAPHGYYQGDW